MTSEARIHVVLSLRLVPWSLSRWSELLRDFQAPLASSTLVTSSSQPQKQLTHPHLLKYQLEHTLRTSSEVIEQCNFLQLSSRAESTLSPCRASTFPTTTAMSLYTRKEFHFLRLQVRVQRLLVVYSMAVSWYVQPILNLLQDWS